MLQVFLSASAVSREASAGVLLKNYDSPLDQTLICKWKLSKLKFSFVLHLIWPLSKLLKSSAENERPYQASHDRLVAVGLHLSITTEILIFIS